MQDYKQYGALALAYMGDCVYELIVRRKLMEKGNSAVNLLHKHAKEYVSAAAQSKIFEFIKPVLTDEETAVYKRGRNSKPYTTAKNASITDYKRATGLESLFGYLFLTENYDRIKELSDLIFTEFPV